VTKSPWLRLLVGSKGGLKVAGSAARGDQSKDNAFATGFTPSCSKDLGSQLLAVLSELGFITC